MDQQKLLHTLGSYSDYKKNLHLTPKINIFEYINILTSTINSILVFLAIIYDDLDYIIKIILAILNITVLFATNLYKVLITRNISPVDKYVANQWNSLTDDISLLVLNINSDDYQYKINNIKEQFIKLNSIEPDDNNFTL
tara:strand:+ start:163 stop:582 length:420 start_codon:yes stop_codon:yes gene_type:complete